MQKRAFLLVASVVLAACKSGGIPTDAKTTVMSFPDLDCGTCGEDMAKALIAEEGVYKTAFDKRRVELTVVAEPEIDALALALTKKPAEEKWHLVLGPGKGAYIPWEKAPEGADVKQVAVDGEDVPDLAPHVVKGKVTIVDFSAKWCEPCRALDAHILERMEGRADIAYRKLDVGDWDTPLGKRYLVGVKELPHVRVFDTSGVQIETVTGLDLPKLDAALDRALEKK